LDSIGPDVVFVNGWSNRAAFVLQSWASRHRVPTVVMSESNQHDFPRGRWAAGVKSRFGKLHSCGLVAGRHARDYLAALGVPDENIFYGYGAVDNDYFANPPWEELPPRPPLPHRPYILAVGRFIPKKNFSTLLQAYAD